MKVYKRRKQRNLFIIIFLILSISVGFAILSTGLNINGTAGINKNTWDIHWNEESIVETTGSVTAKTPAYVSDDKKQKVEFEVSLAVPGDFYEFTVDAKNYGTLDGTIKKLSLKYLDPETGEEIDKKDISDYMPDYIHYIFTHADGTPIIEDEVILVNESIKYKMRIEYDSDATELPDVDDDEKELPQPVIEIETSQPTQNDPTKPYKITFNSNGGKFDNNETTNSMNYTYKSVNVTKYSHTSNIDDTGVANGTYSSNLETNDVVTIPGASSLNIEVWFSTESTNWDWLAIYPAGVTPTSSNSNQATISNGKLGGGYYATKPENEDYHKTFTVDGDTAQFYFKSDSGANYYGYYAIITTAGNGYSSEDTYKEPTRSGHLFQGWNTSADATGTNYSSEADIINNLDNIGKNTTLYAKWYRLQNYTITLDPNGGTVSPTSIDVLEGNAIGALPTPTKTKAIFQGWYNSNNVLVNNSYIPTANETLTAHWKNIYTVTFNPNGGTVSPTSIDVNEGDVIGTLPTPTNGDNIFLGWWTDLQSGIQISTTYQPNSDVTVMAKWGSCGDFATASWSTINTNMNSNPNTYSIGCTKDVDLGTLGTHKVRIINTTTPSECSNSGYSETACGIVLEFEDILVTSQMNSTNTTSGGFPNTIVYNTYLKEDATNSLYSYLPQELKDIIIETKVVSGYGNGEGSNYTQTGEKLFLLNHREIFGLIGADTSSNNTRQEDYYKNKGVSSSKYSLAKKQFNNTNTDYWNRSPVNSSSFRYVQDIGMPSGGAASNTKGISPAFRISNTYTVTFNPNGGTVSPTYKFVAKNGTLGTLPIPEKENDIFKGWRTEISGGVLVNENTIINANVTYYADWASKDGGDDGQGSSDDSNAFAPDPRDPTPADPTKPRTLETNDIMCLNNIKTECFYIIETNPNTTTMIAATNINTGPHVNVNEKGIDFDTGLRYSTVGLQTIYGEGGISEGKYMNYTTASNSIDSYVSKLKSFGAPASTTGRLLTYDDLLRFNCTEEGCPVCPTALGGNQASRYWTSIDATPGNPYNTYYYVVSCPGINKEDITDEKHAGLRPVITIPTSAIMFEGWVLTNPGSTGTNQKYQYWNEGKYIQSGWANLKDYSDILQWYYFENGFVKYGWLEDDNKVYYLSEIDADNNGYTDGNMLSGGTYNIGGTDYTFDNNGVCTSNNCPNP